MKRMFIKTVLATAVLGLTGAALAQDKTIKFANQNAAGHPIIQGMEKFKEIVESTCSPVALWAATRPMCPPCRAARWKWRP
jgi:hypothetical protein